MYLVYIYIYIAHIHTEDDVGVDNLSARASGGALDAGGVVHVETGVCIVRAAHIPNSMYDDATVTRAVDGVTVGECKKERECVCV